MPDRHVGSTNRKVSAGPPEKAPEVLGVTGGFADTFKLTDVP